MSRVARRTDSKEEGASGCGRCGYTRDARKDLRVFLAPSTRTAAMRACWSRRAGSMTENGNRVSVARPVGAEIPMRASMHYGTPSSLPSDYAISSHYANAAENANTDQHAHDFHDTVELNDTQDDINPDRRVIRHTSLPSPYLRPQPLKPFD